VAQTKRQIEAALEQAGMHPRHRFGQNFMIDANLVRLIADSAEIGPEDLVLEVGPGTGTLTEELLRRVAPPGNVTAVEIDRDLAAGLRERLAAEARFELIEGDALAGKHGLNPAMLQAIDRARVQGRTVRLVANLPYNIASPLVVELLLVGVELLCFTVQKEVADRLRAGPANGKEYGPLSVIVQTLAEVEVLRTIPPEAFWPRPKIDSSLVRLRRREVDAALRGLERPLARFVTAVFTRRRKTLRRGLSGVIPDAAAALGAAGLTGEERPEQVPVTAFQQLYLAGGAPEAGPGGSTRAS
jgi:16S rRNA (adenine1518-N6/adenine1519-N6)-dimethyltransferase